MALTFTPQDEFNKPTPQFIARTIFGDSFDSEKIKASNPIVYAFICNHCPYVKAIEDRLITLADDLKKIDIPFVAICSNDPKDNLEDSLENLARRAKEKNYPFIYLHDENQSLAKSFGAVCTPDFFVYNKNYILKYRGRLDDSWKDQNRVTSRELYKACNDLLISDDISFKQTPSMGCNIKWKF
jgi:thiol-disulfide isomerase/thioredoxin